MLKIGLTGGIASGKSTVSDYFSAQGIPIISTDKITHQLQKKGTDCYQQIINFFGVGILDQEGEINRKQLGKIVFADKKKLEKLEEIIHPAVKEKLAEQFAFLAQKKPELPAVIVEVPLLYEAGWEQLFDEIWVVYVNRDTQIKRLQKNRNLDYSTAVRRIDAQMPLLKKKSKADFVIDNSSTEKDLIKQLEKKWSYIVAK